MIVLKHFISGLLVFLVSWGYSQDTIGGFTFTTASILVDNNKNIYLYDNNSLVKRTEDSRILNFSKKMFGDISLVDVSNPHKTLVFYKSQGVCIFLDNYLKELRDPIYFNDIGMMDVEIACSGSDNTVWCFDNSTSALFKIDDRLKIVARSPDISKLSTTKKSPSLLLERDDKIFLLLPDFGLLIFSNSGEYVQTIHLKEYSCLIPLSDKSIFFINQGIPTIYDFYTSTYKQYSHVEQNTVFFYNQETLFQYKTGIVIMTKLQ